MKPPRDPLEDPPGGTPRRIPPEDPPGGSPRRIPSGVPPQDPPTGTQMKTSIFLILLLRNRAQCGRAVRALVRRLDVAALWHIINY